MTGTSFMKELSVERERLDKRAGRNNRYINSTGAKAIIQTFLHLTIKTDS